MAELKVPIIFDGFDLTIKIIQGVIDQTEFKPGVSEDFKQGFYAFGNSAVNALKQIKKTKERSVDFGRAQNVCKDHN